MEKEFKAVKLLVNKVLKKLGDATLDWTIQVCENSADPNRISYACMIHIPSERLEPLTWVCDSWGELKEKLEKASKELNRDMVDCAYYEGEIKRCERLSNFYREKIDEIQNPES